MPRVVAGFGILALMVVFRATSARAELFGYDQHSSRASAYSRAARTRARSSRTTSEPATIRARLRSAPNIAGTTVHAGNSMIRQTALLLVALALPLGVTQTAAADSGGYTHELSAQKRPHITIYPRSRPLGPNAKRYCRAWLAQEYRVSGPVIVPRQYCWWQ